MYKKILIIASLSLGSVSSFADNHALQDTVKNTSVVDEASSPVVDVAVDEINATEDPVPEIFKVLSRKMEMDPAKMAKMSKKGQKFFRKRLKKRCGFTGARFAQSHTKQEWLKIKENGTLGRVYLEVCPKSIEVMSRKCMEYLFYFSIEYAKDTKKFPSC